MNTSQKVQRFKVLRRKQLRRKYAKGRIKLADLEFFQPSLFSEFKSLSRTSPCLRTTEIAWMISKV
jgi:hypothetical protein